MVKEKEKLIWLGVNRSSQRHSTVKKEIQMLRNNVGDYDTFSSDLDNVSSESDFKSYLNNNGFSSSEADSFISKINDSFKDSDNSGSSFDEFKDYVQNTGESYSDLKTKFETQSGFGSELETEGGTPAAGIRTFEESGQTHNNIQVPAGTVEVFGQEIHFTQTGTVKQDGSGSTSGESNISISNFRKSSNSEIVPIGTTVEFRADVTNNASQNESVMLSLTEDFEVIDSIMLNIDAGSTKTILFTVTKRVYFCGEYKIKDQGPLKQCWVPTPF